MQVIVKDGIDKALRQLKKKLRNEGVFKDMDKARAFTKPSVKKRIAKQEAIRRDRKAQAKRRNR